MVKGHSEGHVKPPMEQSSSVVGDKYWWHGATKKMNKLIYFPDHLEWLQSEIVTVELEETYGLRFCEINGYCSWKSFFIHKIAGEYTSM